MYNKNVSFAVRLLVLVLVMLVAVAPVVEAASLLSEDLRIGSRGEDVAKLQEFLNENGFREGNVDGVFGPLTHGSVLIFQEANDLKTDGIVGAQEWELIAETERKAEVEEIATLAISTVDEFNFTAAEMDLFARIVHAESEGEPFEGQVAVAATILNRIRSEVYPNTMSGVVYQVESGKVQYSPVLDGRINRPAGESAKRAVLQALNGTDPTNGATGFFNPSKTSNQWVRSRPVVATIAGHVFFK